MRNVPIFLRASKLRREESAYSLTEMVIVIAILGIIAALAIPDSIVTDESKLEGAAIEVASAMRFAHSEAIRTGVPHGIYATQASQRIRIYRLPVTTPIYDVHDPLTKQLYDLNFSTDASDVAIDTVYFKFKGFFSPRDYLGFSGGTGLPKYNDSGTIRMLETAYIVLSYRGVQKTVQLSPMTARVSVQ